MAEHVRRAILERPGAGSVQRFPSTPKLAPHVHQALQRAAGNAAAQLKRAGVAIRPAPARHVAQAIQNSVGQPKMAVLPGRGKAFDLLSPRMGPAAVIQRMKLSDEEDLDYQYIMADLSSDDSSGDEYDPADDAQDPMDLDEFGSSALRKALCFTSNAKAWMKVDTPKNKKGDYLCHICGKPLVKGQKIDMDHLPPWKGRIEAYFQIEKVYSLDDVDAILLKPLYNMRGSVFAHSSCNRNHSGESHWKQKWKSIVDWFNAGGGPTLDHSKYK